MRAFWATVAFVVAALIFLIKNESNYWGAKLSKCLVLLASFLQGIERFRYREELRNCRRFGLNSVSRASLGPC